MRSSSPTAAQAASWRIASSTASGATVDRALVLLGKASQTAAAPERAGIVIRGNVDAVNVDEWLDARRHSRTPATRPAPRSNSKPVDLDSGRARGARAKLRRDDAFGTAARRSAGGCVSIRARSTERPNGSRPARSSRTDAFPRSSRSSTSSRCAKRHDPNRAPRQRGAKDRRIRGRSSTSRPSVSSRVRAISDAWSSSRGPEGTDWRVSRFSLINDAGRIDAEGTWRLIGRQQQTRFDVDVDDDEHQRVPDADRAFPATSRARSAKLAGQLGWPGIADRLRLRQAVRQLPRRRRCRAVHEDGPGRGQASRRVFAAGAAATDLARLPRRVQRGVRVRHDRRQRADRRAA